jgi:hypothetical protein
LSRKAKAVIGDSSPELKDSGVFSPNFNKSLKEIADAPVHAMQGVSEADAEKLKGAFNVTTMGLTQQKSKIRHKMLYHIDL